MISLVRGDVQIRLLIMPEVEEELEVEDEMWLEEIKGVRQNFDCCFIPRDSLAIATDSYAPTFISRLLFPEARRDFDYFVVEWCKQKDSTEFERLVEELLTEIKNGIGDLYREIRRESGLSLSLLGNIFKKALSIGADFEKIEKVCKYFFKTFGKIRQIQEDREKAKE